MLYNNRLYPHPVLGIGDDVEGKLEVSLKISSDGDAVSITPIFNLDNMSLKTLIKEGKAEFVSNVYCRGTMYRESFRTQKSISDPIRINSERLNGEIELDFLICAFTNINNYSNNGFNNDYAGYTFDIDKGDILAYGGKGKFFANKSPEELRSISAIMNINNSGKERVEPMYNEYDGDKITIMLCDKDYANYQTVKNGSSILWNVLLSAVVLPALIEALYFVDSADSSDYADKQWYKLLKERLAEESGDKILIAQKILKQPNNRAFDSLVRMIDEE